MKQNRVETTADYVIEVKLVDFSRGDGVVVFFKRNVVNWSSRLIAREDGAVDSFKVAGVGAAIK